MIPHRKTAIRTPDAPDPVGPYSQAIRAGGFLFLAGQIPIEPTTRALVAGGIAEQTERAIRNLATILEAAGSGLEQVVRCVVYLKSMDDFASMNAVYARYFTQAPPARTTIEASRLPKDSLIEIEATALA